MKGTPFEECEFAFSKLGSPLQLVWIRCGNTSNPQMQKVLQANLLKVIELLSSGEPIIKLTDGYL
jgi:predicted nuclease of predicted toxin-antitoxin system